jgi:hypothetical protein
LKTRILADWKIPITDPRLKKMNTARWVVAHHALIEHRRGEMRRWSRFVGNDMTVFQRDADGNPVKAEMADIFPLAAILNPEVYHEITEKHQTTVSEDEIDEAAYEAQVQDLEKEGLVTDIDIITDKAEKMSQEQKEPDLESIGVKIDPNS